MILQFAFSPDGNYLLTVSYPDDTARIWDVSTFEVAQSIGPGDITGSAYHGVNSAEFSPDSQWIATCNSDGSIRVWDIKSKNQIQTILVNGVSPAWGAVSPDGKSILTGHANHDKVSVRLWDLASGELVRFHTQQNTSLRPFRNSAVYPWGFAGFLDDDALTVWDGYTGEEKRIAFKTPGLQNIPTFSTDGRYALGVPSYQGVKLFDVKTGEIVGSFGNAAYAVFASDALWGVTSDRGYTRLWKISISAGAPSWRNYR